MKDEDRSNGCASMDATRARKYLEEVWHLSDDFFGRKVTEEKIYTCPISLRLPFIFYVGHLPAFAANKVLSDSSRATVSEPHWHEMFSRGIAPDVDDPSNCHDHPDPPARWPSFAKVLLYQNQVRNAIRALVIESVSPSTLLMVAEHEALHFETLHYMLAQMDRRSKCGCCDGCDPVTGRGIDRTNDASAALINQLYKRLPRVQWCTVSGGTVVTGRGKSSSRDTGAEKDFVWDNEYDAREKNVDTFQVSKYAVTVGEMMAFILDGGYSKDFWDSDDWKWIREHNVRHPGTWECGGDGIEGLLASKVLTANGAYWYEVMNLPASTSLAEARAYARWRKVRLPTEAEWVRAAWGAGDADGASTERRLTHAEVLVNEPRDVHIVTKANAESWCGAVGMIGNGWELTETVFEEFDGFEASEEYPEYSADFFDGKHFVLRGASWVTHPRLVRKSFRNFYHVRYPFAFTKIRVVRD